MIEGFSEMPSQLAAYSVALLKVLVPLLVKALNLVWVYDTVGSS